MTDTKLYLNLKKIVDEFLTKTDGTFLEDADSNNIFKSFSDTNTDTDTDYFYSILKTLANTSKISSDFTGTTYNVTDDDFSFNNNKFEIENKNKLIDTSETQSGFINKDTLQSFLKYYEVVDILIKFYQELKVLTKDGFNEESIKSKLLEISEQSSLHEVSETPTYSNPTITSNKIESGEISFYIRKIVTNHYVLSKNIYNWLVTNKNYKEYNYRNYDVFVLTMLHFFKAIQHKLNYLLIDYIEKIYDKQKNLDLSKDNLIEYDSDAQTEEQRIINLATNEANRATNEANRAASSATQATSSATQATTSASQATSQAREATNQANRATNEANRAFQYAEYAGAATRLIEPFYQFNYIYQLDSNSFLYTINNTFGIYSHELQEEIKKIIQIFEQIETDISKDTTNLKDYLKNILNDIYNIKKLNIVDSDNLIENKLKRILTHLEDEDNYKTKIQQIKNKIYKKIEDDNNNITTNNEINYKNPVDSYETSITELKQKDKIINKKMNKYEKTLKSNEMIMNIDNKNKYILYIVIVFIIFSIIGFFIIENKEIYVVSIIGIIILFYISLSFIQIEHFDANDKKLVDIISKLEDTYSENIYEYLFNQIHKIYYDITDNVIQKEKDKYNKIKNISNANLNKQITINNDLLHESNFYKNIYILLLHLLIIFSIVYLLNIYLPDNNELVIFIGMGLFIFSMLIFIYNTILRSRTEFKKFDWTK
jgi:hypothetical protein